jgi:hypothetical protein
MDRIIYKGVKEVKKNINPHKITIVCDEFFDSDPETLKK